MSATDKAARTESLRQLLDLGGKGAIVTGAAMGIGRAIATRLSEAGAKVLIADLDLADAQLAAETLNSGRANSALAVRCDVSDPQSVEAMLGAAQNLFGSVDILVNNAGIYPMAPLAALDVETFRRVLDINLTGLYLCTRAVAKEMMAHGRGGRIINVTSIDALHPSMIGLAHYDASKHGAWGFTKSVALELAPHGILVNAIAPGGINTPGTGITDSAAMESFSSMIPLGRMGEPDDIGRVALFLASELSSYMTGAQIVVDGGRLLR